MIALAVACAVVVGCGPSNTRGDRKVLRAPAPTTVPSDAAAAIGDARPEPAPGVYKLGGWELGGLGHSDGVGRDARVGSSPLMVVDGNQILVVVEKTLRSLDPRSGGIRTIVQLDGPHYFVSAALDAARREIVLLGGGHAWRVPVSGSKLRKVAAIPELPGSRIDDHPGTVPLVVVKGRTFFADGGAVFEVVGSKVVQRARVCAQTLVANGNNLLMLARTGHVLTYNLRTSKALTIFTPTAPRSCQDWEQTAFFLGTSFYVPAEGARVDVSTKRLEAEPALAQLPSEGFPNVVVDRDQNVWSALDGRIAKFDGKTFASLLVVGHHETWHRGPKRLGAIALCSEGDTVRFRCRAPPLNRGGEDVCAFDVKSQQTTMAADLCENAEKRERTLFALLPSHYAGEPIESVARIDDDRIALITMSGCEACDGKLAIFKLSDKSVRELASFAGNDPGPRQPRDLACTSQACFVSVGTRVERLELATGTRQTVVGTSRDDALRPGGLPASLGVIHGLLVSERGLYILTEGVLVEAVLPPDLR